MGAIVIQLVFRIPDDVASTVRRFANAGKHPFFWAAIARV